jgi:hypothetical protein
MNKKLKSIPKLRSEAEERRFWQRLQRLYRLDQGCAGALFKSQTVNDCDLATPASDAS